jgi:hypothetical protein
MHEIHLPAAEAPTKGYVSFFLPPPRPGSTAPSSRSIPRAKGEQTPESNVRWGKSAPSVAPPPPNPPAPCAPTSLTLVKVLSGISAALREEKKDTVTRVAEEQSFISLLRRLELASLHHRDHTREIKETLAPQANFSLRMN